MGPVSAQLESQDRSVPRTLWRAGCKRSGPRYHMGRKEDEMVSMRVYRKSSSGCWQVWPEIEHLINPFRGRYEEKNSSGRETILIQIVILLRITVIVLYFSNAPKFRKMSIYVSTFSLDRESPWIVSSATITISGEEGMKQTGKVLRWAAIFSHKSLRPCAVTVEVVAIPADWELIGFASGRSESCRCRPLRGCC